MIELKNKELLDMPTENERSMIKLEWRRKKMKKIFEEASQEELKNLTFEKVEEMFDEREKK